MTLSEVDPERNHDLEEESAGRIDQDIVEVAGARRDKALVKFIHAPGNKRREYSQRSPAKVPSLRRRPCSAPGKESQGAQKSVAAEMGRLADEEMDVLKLMMGDRPVKEVNEPE